MRKGKERKAKQRPERKKERKGEVRECESELDDEHWTLNSCFKLLRA